MPTKTLSSFSIGDGLPVKAYQGDCERLATAVARQGQGMGPQQAEPRLPAINPDHWRFFSSFFSFFASFFSFGVLAGSFFCIFFVSLLLLMAFTPSL